MLPGRKRIALVGAGGKTTAAYSLAWDLVERREPVLFTTTTHIYCPAGPGLVVGVGEPKNPGVFGAVLAGRRESRLPVLGRELQGKKLGGYSPVELARIADLWPDHWLIIEADGSAGRPLKAPGAHEPAIVPLAEVVLYVGGLWGIGVPLGPQYVHRPERFSLLTGLPEGEIIRPHHVVDLIRHPAGGRKNVPPGAAFAVLLSGASIPEDYLLGGYMARLLVAAGEDLVLVTGLAAGRVAVRGVFGRGVG